MRETRQMVLNTTRTVIGLHEGDEIFDVRAWHNRVYIYATVDTSKPIKHRVMGCYSDSEVGNILGKAGTKYIGCCVVYDENRHVVDITALVKPYNEPPRLKWNHGPIPKDIGMGKYFVVYLKNGMRYVAWKCDDGVNVQTLSNNKYVVLSNVVGWIVLPEFGQ